MIVVPDAAERTLLDDLLDGVTTYYHLFSNDLTPSATTILGDFVEPMWPAYAPRTVTSWTPALTIAGRAVATADQQLWTRGPIGPPGLVYGYFVTDGSLGPLLWCERRAAGPVSMQMPGNSVLILPRLTLAECEEGSTPELFGGDQVEDGAATVSPPPTFAGGDQVEDGAATVATPTPTPAGGDQVEDGSGSVGPFAAGGGDQVEDGSGSVGPFAAGGGDQVEDGSGSVGPFAAGGGDQVEDGSGTVS